MDGASLVLRVGLSVLADHVHYLGDAAHCQALQLFLENGIVDIPLNQNNTLPKSYPNCVWISSWSFSPSFRLSRVPWGRMTIWALYYQLLF
jgi:hypothetical protein